MKRKDNTIGNAWIRTTVRQAVELKESLLDRSDTTYCILN